MISYKQHHQIDFEKWDHCISNALNGIIYPCSFYLNQVSPFWEALVLNDYEAVMPLPAKKKFGINYLIQPLFVQQLGVFSSRPASQELMDDFFNSIPEKFRYININLNIFNPGPAIKGAKYTRRVTYELDLIAPYDQLKSAYSSQTTRNLKKSRSEKVFVLSGSEPLPVIDAFRMHRGSDIKVFNDHAYEMLKHLIYSGIYRGDTQIYSAYDASNTFCAGVVFFTSHKKSILIFSGATPRARENGAMTAIIDAFIRDHAGRNLTLDFEGSNEKNLARFYAGFGSKECVFLQVEMRKFPYVIQPFANMYFFVRNYATKS